MAYSIYTAKRRSRNTKYGEKTKCTTFSIDPAVAWRFRDVCRDKELKMSAVVNGLIVKWLEEQSEATDK